jgi:hypothetical protein
MSGNVLDRYVVKAPQAAKPSEVVETIDDLGPFAVLRGFDRALMLELRMKDGSSTAFNYNYLAKAIFDPSEGITLQFGASPVHIVGTNLNAEVRPNVRLFQSILRHRVAWIQEADGLASLAAISSSVVIDQITTD